MHFKQKAQHQAQVFLMQCFLETWKKIIGIFCQPVKWFYPLFDKNAKSSLRVCTGERFRMPSAASSLECYRLYEQMEPLGTCML